MIPIRANQSLFQKYMKSGAFARDAQENSRAVTVVYEKNIKEDNRIHKVIDVNIVDKKTK